MIITSENRDFMTEYENIEHICVTEGLKKHSESVTQSITKCTYKPCFNVIAVLKSEHSVVLGRYTTREIAQNVIGTLLDELDEWEEGDSKYIQIEGEEYFQEDCESEEDEDTAWTEWAKKTEDLWKNPAKHKAETLHITLNPKNTEETLEKLKKHAAEVIYKNAAEVIYKNAKEAMYENAKEAIHNAFDKQDKNPPKPQPAKTYGQDFLDKFPKVQSLEYIQWCDLYGADECTAEDGCDCD